MEAMAHLIDLVDSKHGRIFVVVQCCAKMPEGNCRKHALLRIIPSTNSTLRDCVYVYIYRITQVYMSMVYL